MLGQLNLYISIIRMNKQDDRGNTDFINSLL